MNMPHRPRHMAETPTSAPLWLQALTFVVLVATMTAMIWAGPRLMDPGPAEQRDIGRPAIADNPRR
jgi:hypothetical protein